MTPRVEVHGLPALTEPDDGWPMLFTVGVASARGTAGAAPRSMLGRYELEGDVLTFWPRFALKPDLPYVATLHRSRLPGEDEDSPDLVETLLVPRTAPPAVPIVTAVFPTARPLPANLLKFYVHFSEPMSRGFAYEHAHIVDGAQDPIEQPFLELGEELWNPDGTRLTLLLDPGRIKRGLVPHEQLGPVLEPQRDYTLVIAAGWPSADGVPLAADVRIPFATHGLDYLQPDPARWTVEPPRAFTQEPLRLSFDEPLDRALLRHMLRVTSVDGSPIEGRVIVDGAESRWTFVPQRPWEPALHQVTVDLALEDLAGNSVGRPFEVHAPGTEPAVSPEPAVVRFRPRL